MMRGFFIFLVFICKRSAWEATRKRHPNLVKLICLPITLVTRRKSGSQGSTPGKKILVFVLLACH